MAWGRLDDNRHDHPKVLALGSDLYALAAVGLLDHAITWANRHRKGNANPGLVPWAFLDARGGRHSRKLVAQLVNVGLCDADPDDRGVWIHDFNDYTPRRDPEEAAAAGRKGASSRWAKPPDDDPGDGYSHPIANSSSHREANGSSHPKSMANDGSRSPARAPTRVSPTRPVTPPEGSERTPPIVQTLIAEHIRELPRRPAERTLGHLGKRLACLADEGFTPEQLRAGLALLRAKNLSPHLLDDLVSEAAQRPTDPTRHGIFRVVETVRDWSA